MTEYTTSAELAALFAPDERILWQGRPDQAFHFPVTDVPKVLPHAFGMAIGVALTLLLVAQGGWLWTLPLVLIAVSLWAIGKGLMSDTRRRQASRYTLTTVAGYVTLDGRKPAVECYPITAETDVDFAPLNDGLGSVFFGIRSEKIGKDQRQMLVGFERISGADAILALVKDVQETRA